MSLYFMEGEGGVYPGVTLEGCLRWSALPFGGAECRGHAPCPALAPDASEVAVGLSWSFVSFVLTLSQLHRHSVIFSPL